MRELAVFLEHLRGIAARPAIDPVKLLATAAALPIVIAATAPPVVIVIAAVVVVIIRVQG